MLLFFFFAILDCCVSERNLYSSICSDFIGNVNMFAGFYWFLYTMTWVTMFAFLFPSFSPISYVSNLPLEEKKRQTGKHIQFNVSTKNYENNFEMIFIYETGTGKEEGERRMILLFFSIYIVWRNLSNATNRNNIFWKIVSNVLHPVTLAPSWPSCFTPFFRHNVSLWTVRTVFTSTFHIRRYSCRKNIQS